MWFLLCLYECPVVSLFRSLVVLLKVPSLCVLSVASFSRSVFLNAFILSACPPICFVLSFYACFYFFSAVVLSGVCSFLLSSNRS